MQEADHMHLFPEGWRNASHEQTEVRTQASAVCVGPMSTLRLREVLYQLLWCLGVEVHT
jgi:hypothetical protein